MYKPNLYVSIATLLFFLLICCKESPNNKGITDPMSRQFDSLQVNLSILPIDSSLAVLKRVRNLAKSNHDSQELVFRSYCKSALIYFLGKKDTRNAKNMMDSAMLCMSEQKKSDWEPVYNLHLALINGLSDTAVYTLEKVLPHLDQLSQDDRLLAIMSYALLQGIRSNHKVSIEYNLLYLQENRSGRQKRNFADELMVLNNLFFCIRALGDTATAFTYLSEANELILDSIPDAKNVGIIYINTGQYYLGKAKVDSALIYFEKYRMISKGDYAYSQSFMPYLLFAEAAYTAKEYAKANALIDTAFSALTPMLQENANAVDYYFLEEFYDYRYRIKKANGKTAEALLALETRNSHDSFMHIREKNDQILQYERQITAAKSAKELAQKEKALSSQKSILIILVISLFLIIAIAIILVLYWKRKKEEESNRITTLQQESRLREADLKLQAESTERKRIARELHDELGSTLTRIRMAVQVIKGQDPAQVPKSIEILEGNSKTLLKQANEIVWSLNDSNDNLQSLVAYIHHFCSEFLTAAQIQYIFQAGDIPDRQLEGYKRRFIYHAVKEIINNAVKHSQCSLVEYSVAVEHGMLKILISDNGIGLATSVANPFGSGLNNIRNNIEAIGGRLEVKTEHGTTYILNIPFSTEEPGII